MSNRTAGPPALTPATLLAEFRRLRSRSRAIFACVHEAAFLDRPIPLRHPFLFYEGHLDAFNWNTCFRHVLGQPSFHLAFDDLFARGIDPATVQGTPEYEAWPSRAEVQAYSREVEARLSDLLERATTMQDLPVPLQDGHVLHILLEHEAMHHETLMYLLQQLPPDCKTPIAGVLEPDTSEAPPPHMVDIPVGIARVGARPGEYPFSWDNERPCHEIEVPAFRIDAFNVTNAQFRAFIEDGGYAHAGFWDERSIAIIRERGHAHPVGWIPDGSSWLYRDTFTIRPLPESWPAIVTWAEARAYARYRGLDLPTEAEWHRAASGDGQTGPLQRGTVPPGYGNVDFLRTSATRVGSHPEGASPHGVHDLAGNGWEWTSSPFTPFEGFAADPHYPGYSADFFDGEHVVLKGASWFTDRLLLRPSFRNWFYWHYPYMAASFRCVERSSRSNPT